MIAITIQTSTITAAIDYYLFHYPTSNKAGIKLREKGKKSLTTAIGHIPVDIPSGTIVSFTGKWVTDAKWGEQFHFDLYDIEIPDSVHGLKKYLASGLIKGIGPAAAEKIVNTFGLDTVTIIDKEPKRLNDIPGLGPKKIASIVSSWKSQKDIQDVMIFLQGVGISSSYAARIYKVYGKDTVAQVRFNPFKLADEIHGIGFKTADKIASSMGIPHDSIVRIKSGIIFALSEASGSGHCYLPLSELVSTAKDAKFSAAKLLVATDEPSDSELTNMVALVKSVLQELENDKKIVIEDNDRFYLPHLLAAEEDIAHRMSDFMASPPIMPNVNIDDEIQWAEKTLGITFAQEQRDAIKIAFECKQSVVTGGPGTGKSTLLRGLTSIFNKIKIKVALTAPTGRAAKRMEELTGEPAQTIHRLLEYNPSSDSFQKNKGHYIDADLVVIDEVSMLDVTLCNALLKAIPQSSSIVFIGDIDQLPSVGSGQVLTDIIQSGYIPVTRLTKIFRQSEGSLISINAQKINQGNKLDLKLDYKGVKDFYYIEKNTPEEILNEIVSLVKVRLPETFHFNPFKDINVLSPMRNGIIGTTNLNSTLQNALNPEGTYLKKGSRIYRQGDRVLQLKNCYNKNIYNGDSGVIEFVDIENRSLLVDFYGRIVEYDDDDIDELSLNYASTIHKSQGSEYPCCIIPMHSSFYVMLARNLLYTACTRGKKLVILVGTRNAIYRCIKNNTSSQRYTTLTKRIIKRMNSVDNVNQIKLSYNWKILA